ncbi:S-type pyocin domain-containing protein [Pseudomonas faucium]|uniref:S-type pyocin domain-containing protein n=1 Tax=Pseudomonas faucium TaxID=2740518 RepID=UPI0023EE7351|nr:S-type pyocin domain-containing protein [Pseudomonas faucium]
MTWTPARPSGGGEGSSTSLPPAPPGTIVYTGNSLNPVSNTTESYPALDLSEGGGVFDMSNLRIVTPRVHNAIHYREKP